MGLTYLKFGPHSVTLGVQVGTQLRAYIEVSRQHNQNTAKNDLKKFKSHIFSQKINSHKF